MFDVKWVDSVMSVEINLNKTLTNPLITGWFLLIYIYKRKLMSSVDTSIDCCWLSWFAYKGLCTVCVFITLTSRTKKILFSRKQIFLHYHCFEMFILEFYRSTCIVNELMVFIKLSLIGWLYAVRAHRFCNVMFFKIAAYFQLFYNVLSVHLFLWSAINTFSHFDLLLG